MRRWKIFNIFFLQKSSSLFLNFNSIHPIEKYETNNLTKDIHIVKTFEMKLINYLILSLNTIIDDCSSSTRFNGDWIKHCENPDDTDNANWFLKIIFSSSSSVIELIGRHTRGITTWSATKLKQKMRSFCLFSFCTSIIV